MKKFLTNSGPTDNPTYIISEFLAAKLTRMYINKKEVDNKAIEGTFVKYNNYSKGYRIYISGKDITTVKTVKFLENKPRNTNEKTEKQ